MMFEETPKWNGEPEEFQPGSFEAWEIKAIQEAEYQRTEPKCSSTARLVVGAYCTLTDEERAIFNELEGQLDKQDDED